MMSRSLSDVALEIIKRNPLHREGVPEVSFDVLPMDLLAADSAFFEAPRRDSFKVSVKEPTKRQRGSNEDLAVELSVGQKKRWYIGF